MFERLRAPGQAGVTSPKELQFSLGRVSDFSDSECLFLKLSRWKAGMERIA